MKETKVYVDKLPESCGCCEFYSHNRYNDAYCLCLYMRLRYVDKDKDCPLHDIHDHDRELVKEVCEKMRKNIEARNAYELDIINRLAILLDKIEKEFEK